MNAEPTEAMARARESAVGVAFALAGSSMLAASLVFAQVVLRLRTAGGLPAASRPSAVIAMMVTSLMVLANLAFAATSPARRTDVAWRRGPALVAVAFGLTTAVVEAYAGHVLFHAPGRDVFGAIAAALFAWHALHMTAASIATMRVLRRDRAALAAPALLWNHAAFAWIGLAVALWVV